jgi:30S ribosomal protein S31
MKRVNHTEDGNTMGSGDRRTRRGKIWAGTHGKTRPRKKKKQTTTAKPVARQPAR